MSRKCVITVEFKVDGKCPPDDKIIEAMQSIVTPAGYVGSESVDSTDEWGLEITSTETTLESDDPPHDLTPQMVQARNDQLNAENAALRQLIKRLLHAGSTLSTYAPPEAVKAWKQAANTNYQ